MKKKSLKYKMIAVGVLSVLVPLLVVGGFSIYRSSAALEDLAKSQSMEMAKGLAYMANLAVQEEIKIVAQIAQRDVMINAASNIGDEAMLAKAADEFAALAKRSGKDYEVFVLIGTDGKVIADALGGKTKNLDLSDRDYVKAALAGKENAGSVVKSRNSGNIVLTFGAPVYSGSNQVIGAVASVINIDFLSDKIAGTKLGKTGYGYMTDKTGMIIAHPNKDFILKVNLAKEQGMEAIMSRMLNGETGADPYTFKGVKKVAGFAPVPLTGWSVCVTQNYDEFMAPVRNVAWIVVIVGIIFLVVAVVGVSFFSRSIALPIGKIADDLNDASEQVSSASKEVAAASQSLAEGASEHASALEETSSSLEEMASMTKQNADNAAQAKALMGEARQIVDKVDGQMHKMVTAIQDVTRTSEETGKIIKTIDEIAFQTNLLALNAAVEAARAGEAGAGFAVVADEVRNLAMRAADAAKNTSALIENTIVTVKNSRDLTEQTQNAFKENVEISGKVGQLVDEIAAASHEQAQGIGQIGKAVAEMDKVVQNTAASAEESASASEEMNAQAVQMKKFVDYLVAIIEGGHAGNGSLAVVGREEKPVAARSIKPVTARKMISAAPVATKSKPVRPEEVIPFGKDGFKDF